jgi:excisionase family DNA binding protein
MKNTALATRRFSKEDYEPKEEDLRLASLLVEARTSARLSQAEFARRMSVPIRLVEQWESGEVAPSLSTLNEFVAATGARLNVSLGSPDAGPALAKCLHPNPRGAGPEGQGDAAPSLSAGDPVIMTVDEIAALLRLNRKTVYELAHQGKIPVRRIGRSLRANRETLMRWLAEGEALREGRRTRSARTS